VSSPPLWDPTPPHAASCDKGAAPHTTCSARFDVEGAVSQSTLPGVEPTAGAVVAMVRSSSVLMREPQPHRIPKSQSRSRTTKGAPSAQSSRNLTCPSPCPSTMRGVCVALRVRSRRRCSRCPVRSTRTRWRGIRRVERRGRGRHRQRSRQAACLPDSVQFQPLLVLSVFGSCRLLFRVRVARVDDHAAMQSQPICQKGSVVHSNLYIRAGANTL